MSEVEDLKENIQYLKIDIGNLKTDIYAMNAKMSEIVKVLRSSEVAEAVKDIEELELIAFPDPNVMDEKAAAVTKIQARQRGRQTRREITAKKPGPAAGAAYGGGKRRKKSKKTKRRKSKKKTKRRR